MVFQTLQKLLNDVFGITVQNESELSQSVSTILLASVLQIFSRTPSFAFYHDRITSFSRIVQKNGKPTFLSNTADNKIDNQHPCASASEFAATGFYYTGHGDETVCVVCGLGLRDWQPADQANACHIRYSRNNNLDALSDALNELNVKTAEDVVAIPCLFLEAHKILASELPLTRKDLCGIQQRNIETTEYILNLTSRLYAIAEMLLGLGPLNWPVSNARQLGYSENLIILALWKLQTGDISSTNRFVSPNNMLLEPQGTARLLKSILTLEEIGIEDVTELSAEEPVLFLPNTKKVTIKGNETKPGCQDTSVDAPEDFELESLSKFYESGFGHNKLILPNIFSILNWWYEKWPRKVAHNPTVVS